MKRKLLIASLTGVLVTLMLFAGYSLGHGDQDTVQARPEEMPDNPNIAYIGPNTISRGQLDSNMLIIKAVTIKENWSEVREYSIDSPLDALIIDASAFDNLSASSKIWLQQQFHEGVVIVGLGAPSKTVAESLGLSSLRNPNETGPDIGADEYMMVSALLLAESDDRQIYEDASWIESLIASGGLEPSPDVSEPLFFSFSRSRGRLTSDAEIQSMFTNIDNLIRHVYQNRAERANSN